ncbi:hypothetical protein MOXK02_14890 [Moraxella sp. K02]
MKRVNWDYIFLCLPLVFISSAFLGISSEWMHNMIDSWRLQECLILLLSFIYGILRFNTLTIKKSKFEILFIFLLFIYSLTIISFSKNSLLALLDISLMGALLCYSYFVYLLMIQIPRQKVELAIAIVALSPLGCTIWLLVGYYLYITADVPLVWHGLFINIRYYDDALLPLIFLLWYQPGFLKRFTKTTNLIVSFFLLTLWLDAARANWLGISAGLIAIVLFYPKGYQKILNPLISILISFISYRIIQCFDTSAVQYTVLRGEDGTRWRMWIGAWYQWLQNPFKGLGGGNFVFAEEINPLKIGHPHNLIVQLVVEWGVTGLLISFLIICSTQWLINKRSQVPAILFAGSIALLVNMLLSGAHVYPVSQMTILIYFCFIISIIQIKLNGRSVFFPKANQFNFLKGINILKWGLGFILIILFIISDSFFQYGNDKGMVNSSPSLGPRFWSNAHLVNME